MLSCFKPILPPKTIHQITQAHEAFCISLNQGANLQEKSFLFQRPYELPTLIELLNSNIPSANSFAVKYLSRSPDEVQLFYLPQLIEESKSKSLYEDYLRNRKNEDAWTYLLHTVSKSPLFIVQIENCIKVSLIGIRSEGMIEPNPIGKFFLLAAVDKIRETGPIWNTYIDHQTLFNNLTLMTSQLPNISTDHKSHIKQEITKYTEDGSIPPTGVYVPINPSLEIVGIDLDSTVIIGSHAGILVTFRTREFVNIEENHSFPCIITAHEDLRVRQLSQQFIQLANQIFLIEKIPINLKSYSLVVTLTETSEQDQLGGILEYPEPSQDLVSSEIIEQQIIEDFAGYSILFYILRLQQTSTIHIDSLGHIRFESLESILNLQL